MVKINLEESDGISVLKAFGEELIDYLKVNDYLSNHLKIISKNDFLIIPVNQKLGTDIFRGKYSPEAQITSLKEKFEIRKQKYTSISDALVGKIPNELIKFQPVAFDQIGSIAVVDLKDEILQYKETVGNAIIQFNPSVTTVFRKSKAVSGVNRLRGLDLIAGLEKFETIHKEYGIKIFVNLKRIYFSPRLSTEHRRIAELVNDGEVVLDMFGAAAPFALHIASIRDAVIFTVDINESADKIISRSIELNSKLIGKIKVLTGDAKTVGEQLINENQVFDRIIMNHPSGAEKFLHVADKLVKKGGIIHFYSFVEIDDHEAISQKIIEKNLSKYEIVDITTVRQYSPHEYHSCISVKKL